MSKSFPKHLSVCPVLTSYGTLFLANTTVTLNPHFPSPPSMIEVEKVRLSAFPDSLSAGNK